MGLLHGKYDGFAALWGEYHFDRQVIAAMALLHQARDLLGEFHDIEYPGIGAQLDEVIFKLNCQRNHYERVAAIGVERVRAAAEAAGKGVSHAAFSITFGELIQSLSWFDQTSADLEDLGRIIAEVNAKIGPVREM